ncbi:MAG: IS1182 family transposase, partial [Deltaproteobacteria bacterium]|nr:IS1182 family transposase [Deltaproteobacteria bacterium]
GRTIHINSEEALLVAARRRQKHPDWISKYKATRPKVERKIGHMMRRRHGRRVACVRGAQRVGQDFSLLAACMNLVRLAKLELQAG